MEIAFETRGNTYFEHQTSVSFIVDGIEYWFDMVEKGDSNNAPDGNEVDFNPIEDLPFELTEDMKDEMYYLASMF